MPAARRNPGVWRVRGARGVAAGRGMSWGLNEEIIFYFLGTKSARRFERPPVQMAMPGSRRVCPVGAGAESRKFRAGTK